MGIMNNILVVEDDIKFNQIVCSNLNNAGYHAIGCLNAMSAFDLMMDNMIDIIVSDIMMPDMDGFEFAQSIREHNKMIPIMLITSRDDYLSKERGFRIGIDDYMVKPVDMNEFVLRIGALLRRSNIMHEKKLAIGSMVMDADEMTAYVDGFEISLTVKEFNILFKLLSYPKRTFTRNQLMNEFWGLETLVTPRSVDVHINKLRDKFSECKDFEIVTVHGLGYKAVIK